MSRIAASLAAGADTYLGKASWGSLGALFVLVAIIWSVFVGGARIRSLQRIVDNPKTLTATVNAGGTDFVNATDNTGLGLAVAAGTESNIAVAYVSAGVCTLTIAPTYVKSDAQPWGVSWDRAAIKLIARTYGDVLTSAISTAVAANDTLTITVKDSTGAAAAHAFTFRARFW